MFLSPWNLVQAILFALGVWWCKEILSRWRDDLAKMRDPDDQADRPVIVILWSITGLVLLLCVGFALNIGGSIVRAIRDLR
jgi:hypothetical protein